MKMAAQVNVLNRMNEFMSKTVLPGKTTKEFFQKGILMINRSLVQLYQYLQERYTFNFLLTYRLNQDIVEHFFGTMHSRGGLYDHPTPQEFKFRIRKYILGMYSHKYLFKKVLTNACLL